MGAASTFTRISPSPGARDAISLTSSTSAGLPILLYSMTFMLNSQNLYCLPFDDIKELETLKNAQYLAS